MNHKIMSIIWTLSLLITMSACTPSGGGPSTPDTGRVQFLGDLDKKVGELYGPENEDYFWECDRTWKDKALEVAKVLESRHAEIDAYYKDYLAKNPRVTTEPIKFGRFEFRKEKNETIGADQWEDMTYSWAQIYADYLKIKDTPVDIFWVFLNSDVRGQIPDDEDRIVVGRNIHLSKDAGPFVKTFYEKAKACNDDPVCGTLSFSNQEISFTTGAAEYFYVARLMAPENTYSFEQRRAYIKKLTDVLARYSVRYGFAPSDIARVNGRRLEIPMDLSVFGESAEKFISYIESVWNNNADFSIKIVQTNSPTPNYLVKVDELFGERSFVAGKLMQLYTLSNVKVFPHEFGHILGFKDNYYTTWNPGTCEYSVASNSGDIMSQHATGQVLPRHWEQLKKQYWPGLATQPTPSPTPQPSPNLASQK